MFRRTFLTTAVAAGLTLVGAGTASAHECFVVNRSEKGNQNAANSENWIYASVSEPFENGEEFFGFPPLTAEQAAWATEEAVARGVPRSFAINIKHTLPKGGGKGHEGKGGDGKGIDHIGEYIPIVVEVYMEALER